MKINYGYGANHDHYYFQRQSRTQGNMEKSPTVFYWPSHILFWSSIAFVLGVTFWQFL